MAYGCGTNGTKETRPTSPHQFAKQAKCFDVCNRATRYPTIPIPPDSLRGSWQSCFAPIISQWRINDLACWVRNSFSCWHLRICFFSPPPRVLANCPGCPVGLPSHDIDKYQATGLHGIVGLNKFYRYYSTASHDFAEKNMVRMWVHPRKYVVFFKVMFLQFENRINFPKKCQKRW